MSEIIIDDGETRTDLTLENDDTMLVKFGGLASQTTENTRPS